VKPNRLCQSSRQSGAAALAVVMVLFFIISMVAAYTARNLVFEQRTSVNQYRSTQALEVAEAGLEWAMNLLNATRIDDACRPSANVADATFRDRYLAIDPATGNIAPRLQADGITELWPSCVFNGAAWTCNCPTNAAPAVPTPAGAGIFPAFRVRFQLLADVGAAPGTTPYRPRAVRVEVNGCTRNVGACIDFPAQGVGNEGRATVAATFALKPGLTTAPAATLTARGAIDFSGNALSVVNGDPRGSGITVQSSDAFNSAGVRLQGIPGSPGSQSVVDFDLSLAALSADRMFANYFGMWPTTYREQPAAVLLTCAPSCSAAQVRNAASLNPGRVLWLDGAVDFDSAGSVGTPTAPVVIIVNGNISFTQPIDVHGLVYARGAATVSAGNGFIYGALIAEGSLTGTGTPTLVYDKAVLDRLRVLYGSFARVPGSWKDWQ
jgi:PilX N-terminal